MATCIDGVNIDSLIGLTHLPGDNYYLRPEANGSLICFNTIVFEHKIFKLQILF